MRAELASRRAAIVDRLRAAGVSSPESDARWLLRLEVPPEELEELVRRREAREPLQLLLGSWPFRTVDLEVRSGVFVPRPETEVVAGAAIVAAADARIVVDLCTGAGTIASAVAAETSVPRIIATDIDEAAVELARRNLRRWAERVEVRWGDLFDPLTDVAGSIDVLIANPPYLPDEPHEPEVADHDPFHALVGGPDGHEIVDRILDAAPSLVRVGGTVVVEIDDRKGQQALDRARAAGLVDLEVLRDLAGRDRAIRGRVDG